MANELAARLRSLGLLAAAEGMSDLIASATKNRWSHIELFEHLAALEEKERARKSLERRTAMSRIGRFKPMDAFEWSWPTHIDKALVESALSLDFVGPARNI